MKKKIPQKPPARIPLSHRGWIFILFLLAATLIAYLPAWRPAPANAPAIEKPGFVWDDDVLCVGNPLVKDPHGWYEFWLTKKTPDYFPVMSDAFWLQWRVWGMDPIGYRIINLLLHALNAVLVWQILLRLMPRHGAAAKIAATIFALHPVNVASVAWIAELKNTLSFFFFALSLLAYLRFDDRPSPRWYWFSLAAFLLALLSKIEAAPLPLVLLGIALWRRRRIDWKDLGRTIPFFGMALILGLVSVWFQTHVAIAHDVVRTDHFWPRLAGAGWAVWFYFYKIIWPDCLIPVYPRWQIDAGNVLSWLPGILLAAAFVVFWIFRRSWGRPLLFGLGYAVLMFFPVLGFVNIYFFRYSLVADHWQYFSIAGPIALASVALVKFAGFLFKNETLKLPLCFALFALLGVLTWKQAAVYRNSETLWTTTLAKNPGCFVAHNDVGLLLFRRGRVDDAISEYRQALQIDPQFAQARYNLGLADMQKGEVDQAIHQYQMALLANPGYAQAENNLGLALLSKGDAGAVAHFRRATQLNPGDVEAEYNLGSALLQAGAVDEAIACFQKALDLSPEDAQARNNLGNALLQKGNVNEAIAQFEKSLQLNPDDAPALYNLGNALLQKGDVDGAIAAYKKALKSKPDYADAESNLGSALLASNETAEAVIHFQKAVDLNPDDAEFHNNFGSALFRMGKVDDAIAQFQTALTLNPNYARACYNLGNALLQKQHFGEAIAEYEKALQLNANDVQTLNNLAWVLATCSEDSLRDGGKAVELAQRANQLAGNANPSVLGTLAAAYAETGQFAKAVETAQTAWRLARAQPNPALEDVIQSQLKLYQEGVSIRNAGQKP